MERINLQYKTEAGQGTVEKYWFENENTGLKKTLFHRINIPLQPFDSGLEYESQPVYTEIVIEWLDLQLTDPDDLNNLEINSELYKIAEASIYVGYAHNLCKINKLSLKRLEKNLYQAEGEMEINFEKEGVAQNETFSFQTIIKYQQS